METVTKYDPATPQRASVQRGAGELKLLFPVVGRRTNGVPIHVPPPHCKRSVSCFFYVCHSHLRRRLNTRPVLCLFSTLRPSLIYSSGVLASRFDPAQKDLVSAVQRWCIYIWATSECILP